MTLLEVAIALFLLAIGLLGLAGLHLVALRGDHAGQQATMATTLAKAKLAELQKTGFPIEGEDQYIDKANGMTYAREWTIHPDMPQENMDTVVVRVSWRDIFTDRCVTMSTINSRTSEERVGEGNGDFCHS
jgi:hypothetical protein